MNTKIKKEICCICGVDEATTKDHIPPKGIFNRPRPSDLITVPACLKCNNEASINDELFKIDIGMHVARFGGEGEKLFKNGVVPTVKHNKSLERNILKELSPVFLTTPGGIITGKAFKKTWNSPAHDATIERITRGFFYHHYNSIVASNAEIKTYWFDKMPQIPFCLDTNKIANGSFTYFYGKIADSLCTSIWLYQFYYRHWSGAIITEFDLKHDLSSNL